jgi:hypothetical protein
MLPRRRRLVSPRRTRRSAAAATALRGGAVLGSGKFGCVIDPPLPCPGAGAGATRGLVTKVMRAGGDAAAFDAETAPPLLAALRRADPDQRFLAYATLTQEACGAVGVPLADLPAETRADLEACRAPARGGGGTLSDSPPPRARRGRESASPQRRRRSVPPPSSLATTTADLHYFFLPRLRPRPLGAPTEAQRAHAREGLARLHAVGVAHGDIHRHNLMVGPDGQLRIIDFGRATLGATREQMAVDEVALTTALNAEPEMREARQRRPRPRPSPPSDSDDDGSGAKRGRLDWGDEARADAARGRLDWGDA